MSKNWDFIVIFPIYGQFGAIWKPGFLMRSLYKLAFSLIVTFYLTKTENRDKNSHYHFE